MAIVKVTRDRYTAEPLYQWDLNQVLEVRGLSYATAPVVHFTNAIQRVALVCQASMDAAGVITAPIPNSLLQQSYPLLAYIVEYAGSRVKTKRLVQVPVVARNRPADYIYTGEELGTFQALASALSGLITDAENQIGQLAADLEARAAALSSIRWHPVTAAQWAHISQADFPTTSSDFVQTVAPSGWVVGDLVINAAGWIGIVGGYDGEELQGTGVNIRGPQGPQGDVMFVDLGASTSEWFEIAAFDRIDPTPVYLRATDQSDIETLVLSYKGEQYATLSGHAGSIYYRHIDVNTQTWTEWAETHVAGGGVSEEYVDNAIAEAIGGVDAVLDDMAEQIDTLEQLVVTGVE